MGIIRSDKYIEAGRKRLERHSQYDLSLSEVYNFAQRLNEEGSIVIGDIFHLGVEAGARLSAKKSKEKRSNICQK